MTISKLITKFHMVKVVNCRFQRPRVRGDYRWKPRNNWSSLIKATIVNFQNRSKFKTGIYYNNINWYKWYVFGVFKLGSQEKRMQQVKVSVLDRL